MSSPSELANAIRFLSIDAVEQAQSGHPGMPMGMADIATVLWRHWLKHNPKNPHWHNRDRFVLSNGHGSMLLYALLHLTGYELSIQDLKAFRQYHSKTPGHPEVDETPGVETTTGPLGQGLANAVGMALGEKLLAKQFNQPELSVIDHHTYVFLGDGCLMEGVSHEAASLAGTWKLNKLIAFWDDNGISIDGQVDSWFSDDTATRFKAYGWQVIRGIDGHDPSAIHQAIEKAHHVSDKPTLICCKTHIGFGSPNRVDTAKAHGAPLGKEEIAATRQALNWPHAPFDIPANIYQAFDAKENGAAQEAQWNQMWETYQHTHPELAKNLLRRLEKTLPEDFVTQSQRWIHQLQDEQKSMATRKSSQHCLNYYASRLPELLGGSADLTGSNNTNWSSAKAIDATGIGDYIHYGVREFGMSAIMNGLALHGGFIPFGGTFLTFSDYARNAVRMAALMHQKVIFVYTHDSIGLGEDGPTHQPVEHTASLRLIPNLAVWRPCDTVETAVAWQQAILQQQPSALLLTRQNLEPQTRNPLQCNKIAKGGYILYEAPGKLTRLIIATGSEIAIAMAVAQQRDDTRVVSMPCVEAFSQQDTDYQETVLPTAIHKRLVIEAGVSDGWYRFAGSQGKVMGIDTFGVSAPAEQVFAHVQLTVDRANVLLSGL